MMNTSPQSVNPVGAQLRNWRQRRRLSQLDLALDADISPRHLSFLETGRSRPSREMVLRLAEQLDVPLRERNELLVAAGFAPLFPERTLEDPKLDAARRAIDLVLKGHEPFPALAIDRHWTLVTNNAAVPPMLEGIDAELLAPPVNVLRLSLHPGGLAPRSGHGILRGDLGASWVFTHPAAFVESTDVLAHRHRLSLALQRRTPPRPALRPGKSRETIASRIQR